MATKPLPPPKTFTPIIIGVADIVNRSTAPSSALEPATLITAAITAALTDALSPSYASPTSLLPLITDLSVIKTWTWDYPDLPALLAQNLHLPELKQKHYSAHGGNQPAKVLDAAARRIAAGISSAAIVCGGEALASLSACAAAGKLPPDGWSEPATPIDAVFSPTTRELGADVGAHHNIGAPIHIYPLYENGFRARRGQGVRDNHQESARVYGEFAGVAEGTEYAWGKGKKVTMGDIETVGGKNRMICFPYPLLMNAFNTVNLAAAALLTNTEVATRMGIPEERWIYPLGGAGTADAGEFWKRPDYHSSPCLTRSLDAALSVSGLRTDDVDLYDFYSCFPIVPKLAAQHLGLPFYGGEKKLTLLGGLTSFGGAGNNYSMHAITEMTRQLRDRKAKKGGANGLILANGGWLTYQYVVCLGTKPRKDGGAYPLEDVLPEVITDVAVPEIAEVAEGEAVVETYTVEFSRDGSPERGHVVGRLTSNGKRFLANHADARTLKELASWEKEPIGRSGWVWQAKDDPQRNIFSFESRPQL
ncbi:acetyl-CoA acetyltransferas-like protein [Eremomyces bilateralis CBS 781.70]|uniref:Acetyl-CoA acetyltransferas-like protein n=1 Tax=Eremomyces bilateralis CBS 781.70 TaxID=1392243 RepID=A0A6G1G2E9_9PEZI|nr:acetyl-CoA acetyltransferas-like protein [Eremomyces bilateralis CBS 781.70]KAF1812287.1 acetyl-CoA acetyltransferas-like protein [Eremomyces bilateralis CBS 781.70]